MIKNYESLVDEIIETIEDSIETPRDIYVSWYIDPENGEDVADDFTMVKEIKLEERD